MSRQYSDGHRKVFHFSSEMQSLSVLVIPISGRLVFLEIEHALIVFVRRIPLVETAPEEFVLSGAQECRGKYKSQLTQPLPTCFRPNQKEK